MVPQTPNSASDPMPENKQPNLYAGDANTVGNEFSNRNEGRDRPLSPRVDPAHGLSNRDHSDREINSRAGHSNHNANTQNLSEESTGEEDQDRIQPTEPATDVECSLPHGDIRFAEGDRILRLHAADLIAEIQNWAEQIDTRESQLNTRDALLDQRERQFRTWEKFKKQEIDDTIRLTERLQTEVKDRLRRIVAMELAAETTG